MALAVLTVLADRMVDRIVPAIGTGLSLYNLVKVLIRGPHFEKVLRQHEVAAAPAGERDGQSGGNDAPDGQVRF